MRTRTVFRNEEIPGRIAEMMPFLSEGKLPDGTRRWSGHSGPAVTFGHLSPRYHASVREAVYVVYSYDTPIAWVLEVQYGTSDYTYCIPDVGYSVTTGQHQSAVMEAWAPHMRRQGTYRRFPGRGRETVRVPGNAEAYGRERRVRAGGMDGLRPGEIVGSGRPAWMDGYPAGRDQHSDGAAQGPPVRGFQGHRAHP